MSKSTDHKFYDGLLQTLSEAPRTQIDEDIVSDIKKFISEEHTIDEKHNFIQNISKEPLNMVTDKMGVGRISKFIKVICDLDAMLNYGEPIDKVLMPEEKVVMPIPKEGEHVAYGWDGKPFIAKNESDKSKITVEYIAQHQDSHKHYDDMLVKIMSYMDDLMWESKFDVVDKFIEDFCKEDICFQYCLCLLTTAFWAKDKIKNKEMLVEKTRAQGNKEIGEKDTNSCLKGLI
jgi:hypothetical protein